MNATTRKRAAAQGLKAGFVRYAASALFPRAGVRGVQYFAGTALRNGSDADVIYYLDMNKLPVINTES